MACIDLQQKSCSNKIPVPHARVSPGAHALTKKPEDSGYEIVTKHEWQLCKEFPPPPSLAQNYLTGILVFKINTEPLILGWFSFECRKTKTKVITLANQNRRKQRNEPIRNRSKYMQLTPSAGKRMGARHDWFWFCFSLVENVVRVLLTNHRAK